MYIIYVFLFQLCSLFFQKKKNISVADVPKGVCHKTQNLYVFKDTEPPKFSSIKEGN